ncbi:unnamed protein product [Choristocarpus tenellus]
MQGASFMERLKTLFDSIFSQGWRDRLVHAVRKIPGGGRRGGAQQESSLSSSGGTMSPPPISQPPMMMRSGWGGIPRLNSTRAQTAVWAVEGLSTLMVCAPGESPVWSLEPMIPVTLGSLSGLLLAIHALGQASDIPRLGGNQLLPPELQGLARSLEKALADISRQYRPRLPCFRFPQAYAAVIDEHCQ